MYNPDEDCKVMIAELRRLCKQKNMTPHALAKKAGISTSTLSYLMNGKTKPQVYTVLNLCNVLGVSISELFSENVKRDFDKFERTSECGVQYLTCEEERMLCCCRCLSDKKKEMLRIYIDMLLQYDEKYKKDDE